MKNIKRLLVATIALISMSTMASLLQPVLPVNDDAPVRVNFGLTGALAGGPNGFGLQHFGGGIGFTHSVGYDVEYGLSVMGGSANWRNETIWTAKGKDKTGFRLDVDLMLRYMPELADRLRAGIVLNGGWGDQFNNADGLRKNRSFGDLNFKPGLAVSYGFSDSFSAYVGVQYSLHNIRFGADKIKDYSNLSGLDIPFGMWFGFANQVGVFIEANSRFTDFKKFAKSFREEITLGVSYAI